MANQPRPTAPAPEQPSSPELAQASRDETSLRRFLHGLPGVDRVGLEQRATALTTRSVKKESKLRAIDMAIGMIDLTTLEGSDTEGKVRALAAKARRPDPEGPIPDGPIPDGTGPERSEAPPVAALCVYPDLAATAVDALAGTDVQVASVATAFPSGRSSLRAKLVEVEEAVAAGAAEVDMVLDRGAFLAGRYGTVFEEIRAVRAACGPAHLKVILETGELATYDDVRRAAWLALLAGADECAATVFLEVRWDNEAAIRLYRAHDFEVVGVRKRYYQPSGADAYTMRRPGRSTAEEGGAA